MHGHTDGRKNQKQMPPAHLMDELRNENRPPHLGIPWNNWSLLPIKCTQLKSTDFSLGKSITHGLFNQPFVFQVGTGHTDG